jgi:hypothetical protein
MPCSHADIPLQLFYYISDKEKFYNIETHLIAEINTTQGRAWLKKALSRLIFWKGVETWRIVSR